jgi:hypothetical protein
MKIKVKIRDRTDTLKCYDDIYVIILSLRAGIKPLTRQLFNDCATNDGQFENMFKCV